METLKRAAVEEAANWIEEGMVVGLGTGSTIRHLLQFIAEQRAEGRWRAIRCVPTSADTRRRATDLDIPLFPDGDWPDPDVTIDGADEVDPELNLIKGLGAALLREKIVAAASRRLVIVVDDSKLVEQLGTQAPLPVEVEPFGATTHKRWLEERHGEPTLRTGSDGSVLRSDGGHWIYDCRFPGGIEDAAVLARALEGRPGILEHGLFHGMAEAVVVASNDGVSTRRRGVGAPS